MRLRGRTSRILFLSLTSLALSFAAQADITDKDLQVLGRSLGFVKSAGSASSKLIVVYDPKKPQSQAEADSVQSLIGGGLKAGQRSLTGTLVKVDELGSVTEGAAIFVTSALGDGVAKARAVAKALHSPCVTVDSSLVQSGACTISVKTSPKVEILVNKAAAAEDGVTLDDAFKMLITEI